MFPILVIWSRMKFSKAITIMRINLSLIFLIFLIKKIVRYQILHISYNINKATYLWFEWGSIIINRFSLHFIIVYKTFSYNFVWNDFYLIISAYCGCSCGWRWLINGWLSIDNYLNWWNYWRWNVWWWNMDSNRYSWPTTASCTIGSNIDWSWSATIARIAWMSERWKTKRKSKMHCVLF